MLLALDGAAAGPGKKNRQEWNKKNYKLSRLKVGQVETVREASSTLPDGVVVRGVGWSVCAPLPRIFP